MAEGSNKGWVVTFAGTGINLALGVLYSWSVISKKIPDDWGWTEAQRALPYTIACLIFALTMVPAGKLQDRFGPRVTASLGGILTGLGLILASRFQSVTMYILGFGVLAGSGIGFGYASATPPAVKWFPPAKTGMIAGLVVAGFGLASVYIAPSVNYLIGKVGIQQTFLILGIAFMAVVVLFSQFLVNPPSAAPAPKPGTKAPLGAGDFNGMEVVKTPMSYLLWLMFAFNAGAGLMVIGKLAKVVEIQASFKAGFILVALLAIGNAGGRIIAGTASDKLGRIRVLQIFTAFQAVLMFLTPFITTERFPDPAMVKILLIFFSVCIGMNYGSNLALFPSLVKDFYGLKNFGVNYGLVFTSWGVGSLMALVAGMIYDKYHTFNYAFFIAGGLLIVTILLSFGVKKPEKKPAAA